MKSVKLLYRWHGKGFYCEGGNIGEVGEVLELPDDVADDLCNRRHRKIAEYADKPLNEQNKTELVATATGRRGKR